MAAEPNSLFDFGHPVEMLGMGNYGHVILTDKNYAVKIMTREFIEETFEDIKETIAELTNSEINSIVIPSCLDHPNIIKYHNVSIGTENISLIMDVYDNDVFTASKQDYKIFQDLVIFKSLCAQMVGAVAYLTSLDILHGDIKPPNILFKKISEDEYKFVLADFDFAHNRVCSSYLSRHPQLYTPGYQAPEILLATEGRRIPVSHAADVWALGISLAFIYRGEFSFLDLEEIKHFVKYEHKGDLSYKVSPWSFPVRSFVDNPEVETFVRKMVQFEPQSRASIFELQNDEFLIGAKGSAPKITANLCYQRILAFDRNFDFTEIPIKPEHWNILIGWLSDVQNEFTNSITSEMFIMAIELIARYIIIEKPEPISLQCIGCAGLYLAATVFNLSIDSLLLSGTTNSTVPATDINDSAIDMLIKFNYDLCAKTGYDEIYRYIGIIDYDSSQLAVNLLSLSYLHLDLFGQPKTAKIALYLATQFLKGKPYNKYEIIDAEAELWKNRFIEHFSNDRKLMGGVAANIISFWKGETEYHDYSDDY